VGLDWRDHVRHDPAQLRPAEIPCLRGDASRARRALGWAPALSFDQLVERMVRAEVDRLAAGLPQR
jgi:GDPmannose 4,6-dehydratase